MPRYLFPATAWLVTSLALGAWGQQPAPEQGLDHLVRAAAGLEQAGLGEQAAEIRLRIQAADAGARQRLLEQKLAVVAGLQAEIAELRQSAAASPQVAVHLQLLSLDRPRVQALGLSFAQLLDQSAMLPLVDDTGELARFLDALRQHGLAQVWAEPTLIAREGRAATYVSGGVPERTDGQAAAALDPESPNFYGTYVRCTPHLRDSTISLELLLRVSRLLAAPPHEPAAVPAGASGGAIRDVAEISTTLQLAPNQQLILGGQRQGDSDSALVLVVRAELVQGAERPAGNPTLQR